MTLSVSTSRYAPKAGEPSDMKFLIDENVNVAVCAPLNTLFSQHTFHTVADQAWSGFVDDALFPAMAEHQFGAIITRDKNQLSAGEERDALRSNNLHWIGMKAPTHKGLLGLALETAAIIAGLPFILDDIADTPQPTAFHITGVPSQRTQRVKVERL